MKYFDLTFDLYSKYIKLGFYAIFGVSLILIAFFCLRSNITNNPVYDGKPLSDWLVELVPAYPSDTRLRAKEAVRSIGTNSIPLLLRFLSEKDGSTRSILKAKLEQLLKLPASPEPFFRRIQASHGFEVLGSMGRPAIPRLEVMMRDNDLVYDASCALGATKLQEVLPILLSGLTNSNPKRRMAAAAGLGSMRSSARSSVAKLTAIAEKDENLYVRMDAIVALGKIGPADAIIPFLLQRLEGDINPGIRGCAAYSLSYFPEKTNLIEPILLQASHSPIAEVSAGANNALRSIRDDWSILEQDQNGTSQP